MRRDDNQGAGSEELLHGAEKGIAAVCFAATTGIR
jgi:hypothetical protein